MQPVSTGSARSPHYAACLQAAAEFGAPVAQRIAGKAGEALLRAAAAAGPDERRLLIDASRLLAQARECLRNAYPGCLHREFAALDRQEALRQKPLTFDALELMGDEQVEETVEVVRGQQAVLCEVDVDLATLNALVCAAKGRATVSAQANPLRPQAWVQALRNVCLQCEVPPWALVRWLPRLSEALGPELASVYRQLCEVLRRQGISDAAFGLRPAAPAPAPRPSALAPLLTLKDLRRLLAGDGERSGHSQWAPTDFGAAGMAAEPGAAPETAGLTMPWALDALQDTRQLEQVMRRLDDRRSTGDLAPGAAPAATPAQALAQEVVRLMVDAMAGDRRLLPPVRQVLRDLEPALLRLACNDPRFFRDPHHPTRQFLTEMTDRSLAWSAPDLPGFAAFMEPLQRVAAALAGMPMETAEAFEHALRSLEDAWSQQEERGRRERANAARALIKAERRNLLARRIAERLGQRPDVRRAPQVIRHFLAGPWAQVIAAAQMADPSGCDDPGGYGAVADDLLWSIQPQLAAEQQPSLAKLVPRMIAALRGGLASIEYPEAKVREFLRELAVLHRLALQSAAEAPPAIASDSAARPEHERDDEFWLEPTEARESSLMEAIAPSDREAVSQHAPLAVERDDENDPRGSPVAIEQLEAGAWADLFLDGAWSRWRLAWASPQLLLFMFADGAGKYRSMTRSVLQTLIAIGALRLVSGQTIMAGALDAVAEAALRNSTESVR